jgi:hypothetical protein
MSEIGVVHLVWAPLGIDPFRRFLASYRQRRAGAGHDLLVAFNGFRHEGELGAYRALLAGLGHRELLLPEPVQDIPAYFAAFRAFADDYDYYCVLNSHSELLADDWLAKLRAHAGPGVGAVGATASYTSHATHARSVDYGLVMYARCLAGHLLRGRERPSAAQYLAWRRESRSFRRHYPPFPNPHVRTNAFLMPRAVVLGLEVGPIADKQGAMRFESGKAGLTRQLLAAGLRPLVVGRDGRAYEPGRWPESRTYRSGAQENLLVADNRTRQYAEADPETRRLMAIEAWGRPRADERVKDELMPIFGSVERDYSKG